MDFSLLKAVSCQFNPNTHRLSQISVCNALILVPLSTGLVQNVLLNEISDKFNVSPF